MAEMELDHLDRLVAGAFDGYIVRKDLVRKFARQYPVPTYVCEFLLGRYCASTNEEEIAFENVLIKRIPPMALLVGVIVYRRMSLVVAIPRQEANAPAILNGNEIGRFLMLFRQDARPAGEAQRMREKGR